MKKFANCAVKRLIGSFVRPTLIFSFFLLAIPCLGFADDRLYECFAAKEKAALNISTRHSVVMHSNFNKHTCTFSVDGAVPPNLNRTQERIDRSLNAIGVMSEIYSRNTIDKDRPLLFRAATDFEENSAFLFASAGPYDDDGEIDSSFFDVYNRNKKFLSLCILDFYSGMKMKRVSVDKTASCSVIGENNDILLARLNGQYFSNIVYLSR
ncbi:MAG TPA: hypothetical protein VKA67_11955 [Verrucomicrobiae bacterium]|nr:hypothetical protein [Verrucomicrobiae bacterium]